MTIRLEFKIQDCWIGVFWKKTTFGRPNYSPHEMWFDTYDVWICVVPMLPIHISWTKIRMMPCVN